MTTALLTRSAALLEAAEAMIGLLRDHTEELATGEAYDALAIDAATELLETAQALRAIIDTEAQAIRAAEIGATNTAFDALVAMHAHLLDENENAEFFLTGVKGEWVAVVGDFSSAVNNVFANGTGPTTEKACEAALDYFNNHIK